MTESGRMERWSKDLFKTSDPAYRIRKHFLNAKDKRNLSSQGSKQGSNKNDSYGFTFEKVNMSQERGSRLFIKDARDPFRYKKPKESFD